MIDFFFLIGKKDRMIDNTLNFKDSYLAYFCISFCFYITQTMIHFLATHQGR